MTQKKPSLPPLKMIDELLVLGGRYRFSRGQTKRGAALLYVSMPGAKGGLSVLLGNLPAFQRKLGEVIEALGDLTDKDGVMRPVETDTKPEPTPLEPAMCQGPTDESWLTINLEEGGLEDNQELFEPHEFQGQIGNKDACAVCTYSTVKVEQYKKTAGLLTEPVVTHEGRSVRFP